MSIWLTIASLAVFTVVAGFALRSGVVLIPLSIYAVAYPLYATWRAKQQEQIFCQMIRELFADGAA